MHQPRGHRAQGAVATANDQVIDSLLEKAVDRRHQSIRMIDPNDRTDVNLMSCQNLNEEVMSANRPTGLVVDQQAGEP
jgi:hypothetical protein